MCDNSQYIFSVELAVVVADGKCGTFLVWNSFKLRIPVRLKLESDILFTCRHCIATISPPDEEYFRGRLPLPHVPSGQGNRLPIGEGCWLCGISELEKADLTSTIANSRNSRPYRKKRNLDLPINEEEMEQMLSEPIRIVVNTSMTKVKDKRSILTLVQAHKHAPTESYKLFGDGKEKFRLNHQHDTEVSLTFQHKVAKRRTYKLILMITDGQQLDGLSLIPISITVTP